MFGRTKKSAKKKEQTAEKLALEAFRGTYPDRQASPHGCSTLTQKDDATLVQVCWGSTRPQQRSWWLVQANGDYRELSLGEAERVVHIPRWL